MWLVMQGNIHEFFTSEAKLRPVVGKVFIHEPEGEFVIAGGDGSVGGEDVLPKCLFGGICKGEAFCYQFTNPLQG